MTFLKKILATALPVLALAGPATAATNLSGSYLLTLKGHPSVANGQQLCATLVENGSVLGFVNSGTFSIVNLGTGGAASGKWFTQNFAVTFEAPFSTGFIVFSGTLGKTTIQGTSYIQVVDGKPDVAGTFTATKGCPTAE